MPNAIVMFSGGQDSTTCLYWAKKEFGDDIQAVGFNYGQKHIVELKQASKIALSAGVPFMVYDLGGIFSGSSLVDHSLDVEADHHIDTSLPSSFTAGRNAVFLSVAAGIAYNLETSNIVGGMCQTDFSGYPDCRRVFIDSMEESLGYALDTEINIHTPLMYLTKAETWKLAKDLGCLEMVIQESHTDYNGNRTDFNEWGYGALDNPASQLRAEGYEEAKANGWL